MFADKSNQFNHYTWIVPNKSTLKIGESPLTVNLINHDGEWALPIPGDISPKYESYHVFQTEEGVILCVPLRALK